MTIGDRLREMATMADEGKFIGIGFVMVGDEHHELAVAKITSPMYDANYIATLLAQSCQQRLVDLTPTGAIN